MPNDAAHTVEDRNKLYNLMQAELIWRIANKVDTLVLGMMTQGECSLVRCCC
jgi:hypothetical protein